MFEIKFIRQNLQTVKKSILNRGITFDWESFQSKDNLAKKILQVLENLRQERNTISNQIAKMKKNNEDTNKIILKVTKISSEIKELEKKLNKIQTIVLKMALSIPNLTHSSTPIGKNKTKNIIKKTIGQIPTFNFDPLPHWIIGKNLKLFNLNKASKITGTRFPLLTGAGALMERALINFMLNIHITKHGYYEISPPLMINKKSLINTGQLPKFEKDLFKIENYNYFLIPTAEVPLINIHQNETLDKSQLPIRYVAYSPCFRSEAGSYGKDTKGLIRQHQFNKIELIKFSEPETSYYELEKLLNDAETILQYLNLPYRVITLCTGDIGFSSSKTYDIEVWMPSQKKYIEISSCSNSEDFQSRRANIKFKKNNKKNTKLVHTLNGSALAVGRTMAAVLENYQQADGSVIIPDALRPFMHEIKKIDSGPINI